MARRFSRLEYSYRVALQTPDATTLVQPGDGTVLGKYLEFKAGNSNYEVDPTPSGGLVPVGISPFYLATIAVVIPEKVSKRGHEEGTLAAVRTAANIQATADVTDTAPSGYRSAKAVIATPGGSGTDTPSKITGISYKKIENNTFTLPMGIKTGELSYLVVAQNIAEAVGALAGTKPHTVSFRPERPGRVA